MKPSSYHQIVRSGALGRVHIALDFFDASMNRVGAWVLGARATLQALLLALLEPAERLQDAAGDSLSRLALLEQLKALPFGAVWDYHCLTMNVPPGMAWLQDVREYERRVISQRS